MRPPDTGGRWPSSQAAVHLAVVFLAIAVYSSSGWYKIQGPRWQDGTALYYAPHTGNVTCRPPYCAGSVTA
ncbi:hypothetical protein [Streptomyces achromogenes]|uniref:hypothetical protein n=1 Tax=Streptomyces achromogenes TaxID=67255 RepID=UPI00368D73D7